MGKFENMNEGNTIIVPHGGKKYRVTFSESDQDIDVEDVVTIHYNNIIAELIIFPVILQRIGTFVAVKKNEFAFATAALEHLEADLRKRFRLQNETAPDTSDEKGKSKRRTLTVQELADMVVLDDDWIESKKRVIRLESEVNKMENLYWSCKYKYNAVETISHKLSPDEFKMDLIKSTLAKLNSYGLEVEKMSDF